jgi:predicted nucleotidyltransferase
MPRTRPPKRSGKAARPTSGSSRTLAGDSPGLATLKAPLGDLLQWLASSRIPHVLIGGVAVGFVARPRATVDIDGIVWVDDAQWPQLIVAAGEHGFSPREADPIEFIRQTRMLLLTHDGSGVHVDLSLGALPFERAAIARRQMVRIEGLEIPVPAPADLIVMKAIAHRPQDLADIDAILKAHPSVDMAAIESTVRAFAEVLEQPELVEDLQRVVRGSRRWQAPRTP